MAEKTSSKSYIDPTVKKTVVNGEEVDTRTMKRRRGRPKKTAEEGAATKKKSDDWVIKTVRFKKDEYAKVEENMEKNHVATFNQFVKHATLDIRPVIISTDDFTLLRQARRDIVNYSNSFNSIRVSDEQRAKALTSLNVQVEWGLHLKKVVEQVDRIIDRMHNKIVILPNKEDNKEDNKEEGANAEKSEGTYSDNQ